MLALGLGACGGDGSSSSSTASTSSSSPSTTRAAPSPRADGAVRDLPGIDDVPQTSDRRAPDADRRVAEAWFAAVRRGDPRAAAALMADGTRFVNGDPVVLPGASGRVGAAASLPCGAVPIEAGGAAGGYVVLRLRLVDGARGACQGKGGTVAVALRIREGRIDDWVRLDAAPGAAEPGTAA